MNRFIYVGVGSIVIADLLPIAFLIAAGLRISIPRMVVPIGVLAPPVIGGLFLLSVGVLRVLRQLPPSADSVRVGIVLAAIGIIEPLFYWM